MNYKETIDKLFNMLPDFQKVGGDAYKPGLERVSAFLSVLGDPQDRFLTIHVAGTNGKGSVSHMLASVLTAAGYRTGLYTSPHLRDFRERIKIDGGMISEDEVTAFSNRHMETMDALQLSFFEATVAMAFDHFVSHGVDIAVVETGLGGRLDATNVINPVLSVITNIGMDHMSFLGDSVQQIAAEKAGIIKAGIPVVVGERKDASAQVFMEAARRVKVPITFAEDKYEYISSRVPSPGEQLPGQFATFRSLCEGGALRIFTIKDMTASRTQDYQLDLLGLYQRKNIVTALAALGILRGKLNISRDNVVAGLATTAVSTGLEGRWQVMRHRPLVVCDSGHNEHGIKEVTAQIAGQDYEKLYMVVGFVRDKDLGTIIPLLPKDAYYIFTQPEGQRALPAEELHRLALDHGLAGETGGTVPEAIALALTKAGVNDMVFIGGSSFVVAEAVIPRER